MEGYPSGGGIVSVLGLLRLGASGTMRNNTGHVQKVSAQVNCETGGVLFPKHEWEILELLPASIVVGLPVWNIIHQNVTSDHWNIFPPHYECL